MNKGIVKEGIFGVLKLRWMSMFKNYRKRVKNIEMTEADAMPENKMVAEGK